MILWFDVFVKVVYFMDLCLFSPSLIGVNFISNVVLKIRRGEFSVAAVLYV